jgi:peptidyl-prolyl cis-trans isomerase SurA
MKSWSYIVAVITVAGALASGQVASHAPVSAGPSTPAKADVSAMAIKPVARVNGAVLTEIDLKREMYMMFPYAQQHGGVPKTMEPEIRKGAMDMMIFEELLYQEAKRRKLQVAPAQLAKAEASFRKQFPTKAVYEQYLKLEFNGSTKVLQEKIRRSLLIEQMLKTEVNQKSRVTLAAARSYYDKNPKEFQRKETFAMQTISIIPPEHPSKEVQEEAKAKIKDALRLARQTKTQQDFGLLAEQISDDDWRLKLGNRGRVEASSLPPEIVKLARTMKPNQVSDIVQLNRAYVIFRLNAHTPAGRIPFIEAKKNLLADLQKQKVNERRAELHQQLRKDAKIEVL